MYLKRLKELREDNDKKQYEVAEYLKITQQQYSLYESGKRDIPTELVIKLAIYYKVSADYMLELSQEERKSWLDENNNKNVYIQKNKKIENININ